MRVVLEGELQLSRATIKSLESKFPRIWGVSIQANLKPTAAWLADVGLTRKQVAKVVAGFPPVLRCSIEANLKPTVAWLEDVGLSRQQVAKVVAGFPPVLGYSIDGNLKPTVAWLEDVGLSREQVAKVVATLPQVLGYSIDGNLKPTVAWLQDVGLSREQVAKVVARNPQVLGYSIRANLSVKHQLLQGFFCDNDICRMFVYLPAVLGYSIRRLHHRLHVLHQNSQMEKLAATMRRRILSTLEVSPDIALFLSGFRKMMKVTDSTGKVNPASLRLRCCRQCCTSAETCAETDAFEAAARTWTEADTLKNQLSVLQLFLPRLVPKPELPALCEFSRSRCLRPDAVAQSFGMECFRAFKVVEKEHNKELYMEGLGFKGEFRGMAADGGVLHWQQTLSLLPRLREGPRVRPPQALIACNTAMVTLERASRWAGALAIFEALPRQLPGVHQRSLAPSGASLTTALLALRSGSLWQAPVPAK
ncbi:MTERF4, partial [Symbiodinium necroappetens]